MVLVCGDDEYVDSDTIIQWTTVGNYSSTPIVPSEAYSKEFQQIDKELGNHVYLICTKPKLTLENFCKKKDGSNRLKVDVVRKKTKHTKAKRHTVVLPDDLYGMHEPYLDDSGYLIGGPQGKNQRINAVQVIREYAFRLSQDKSNSAAQKLNSLVSEFAALKVVYVGQAYGNSGSRTSLDRLKEGHKTFTNILAVIHDYDSDLQAYILLIDCHVKRQEMRFSVNASSIPKIAASYTNLLADDFGSETSLDVVVDAVEASLIRYFQPRENTLLKDFPHAGSKKLKEELTSRGMDMLGVQLDVRNSCVLVRDKNDLLRSVISVFYDLKTGNEKTPPSVLSNPHIIIDGGALSDVSEALDPESAKFIPDH